mgnify:CR=1 FL=1
MAENPRAGLSRRERQVMDIVYRLGEATVTVDPELTLGAAHDIATAAEHRLVHEVPHLLRVVIHVDPHDDSHASLAHHPGTEP